MGALAPNKTIAPRFSAGSGDMIISRALAQKQKVNLTLELHLPALQPITSIPDAKELKKTPRIRAGLG
jgi:hypothetical protein